MADSVKDRPEEKGVGVVATQTDQYNAPAPRTSDTSTPILSDGAMAPDSLDNIDLRADEQVEDLWEWETIHRLTDEIRRLMKASNG